MKNILFITADQLRYDAMGFQGFFPVETPNIDRLAQKGTRFENVYCSNPLCAPCRASIMTGKYCHTTGVYYNDQPWDENLKTLPGELGKNGYYTIAVGKMHFNPPAWHHGFHKRSGAVELHYNDYLAKRGYSPKKAGKPKGDGTVHSDEPIQWNYTTGPTKLPLKDYITVYTANIALHEMDLISKRRECGEEGNEPFFMWLSFTQPHAPSEPPEPYFSMYNPDDMPTPIKSEEELEKFPAQLKRYKKHWDILDEEELIRKARARYLGDITLLDEQIGRILDKLNEMGIMDNTLIVFSSDHGDMMGDHHCFSKNFFFESSAKVPLIFYGPGIPQGKVIQENISQIDLFPTLMEYSRLSMRKIFDEKNQLIYQYSDYGDAVSQMPAFTEGKTPDPRRIVISESGVHGHHIMLKQGDKKINYYADTGEIEYYDLTMDPHELDNQGSRFAFDTLPSEIKQRLQEVLNEAKEYNEKFYVNKGKRTKMFT